MSFFDNSEILTDVSEDFFKLKAQDIDGKEIDFIKFKGSKAYIVVNVASACGYTNSHYKGLMDLYTKYK